MSTYVILQFFFPSIFLQLNEEKEKIQVFFVFSLLSNKLKHFIFHSFIFFYFVFSSFSSKTKEFLRVYILIGGLNGILMIWERSVNS